MKQFLINIVDLNENYRCTEKQSVLAGMESLGRKGIPIGCRGGGCGVCKIHISRGDYMNKKMSRAQVTEQEEKEGYALACRCYPQGDLDITVVGKMKQVVDGSQSQLLEDI